MNTDDRNISVQVPNNMDRALHLEAAIQRVSKSELIRRAIQRELERLEATRGGHSTMDAALESLAAHDR